MSEILTTIAHIEAQLKNIRDHANSWGPDGCSAEAFLALGHLHKLRALIAEKKEG